MQIPDIEIVSFLANVKVGTENTTIVKTGPNSPFAASFEAGIVTVKHVKQGAVTYVPVGNVAYMMPRLAPKEAPKK
jgi:hypothetical protein